MGSTHGLPEVGLCPFLRHVCLPVSDGVEEGSEVVPDRDDVHPREKEEEVEVGGDAEEGVARTELTQVRRKGREVLHTKKHGTRFQINS